MSNELSANNSKIDFIVAGGSIPPEVPDDFYARVPRIGKDIGAQVVVDTSDEALRLALSEGVYLIKPNIREFSELAGQGMKKESEIKNMAMEIAKSGQSKAVVISLGAAGILIVSQEGHEHIQPPTVPIVSKEGAGDSKVVGIVLSLSRGNSLTDAARFGVAAGAAAVMTPGTELCRREDT